VQLTALHSRQSNNCHAASLLRVVVFAIIYILGLSGLTWAQSQVVWNFLGPAAARDRVIGLAADPQNDNVIYLAAPGGGVWRTDNAGQMWTPRMDAILSGQICSIAADPQSSDIVYAGTGDDQNPRPAQTVVRSTDGGRSWTFAARFTNQPVCALAIDPSNSAHVFAGSSEGLFASTDHGVNWSEILAASVTSVAVDTHGTVYAGTISNETSVTREKLLTRSSDGGHTWTNVALPANSNVPGAQTTWVSVIAARGSVAVAVAYSATTLPPNVDFYRTVDDGITWSNAFGLVPGRPPIQLLSDPVSGNLYLAATRALLSTNGGSNWQTFSTATSAFHTAVLTGGTLLLGGENGLEAVTNGQSDTTRILSQLPIGRFLGVSVDSASRVWGAGQAGLFGFFSTSSFADRPVPEVGPVGRVAAAGSTNIFASGNPQIYGTGDLFNHVSARNVFPDTELRAPYPPLIQDPFITATAYTAGSRFYRTMNGGNIWSMVSSIDPDPSHVVTALAISPIARFLMYAATVCLPEVAVTPCSPTSQIWRSQNGGTSWTQLSPVNGLVNHLAVDPRNPGILYAAIGGFPGGPSLTAGSIPGDLLQSTNSGTSWTSVRSNLPRVPINTIVIDPTAQPGIFTQPSPKLFVGTDAGVFVTFNGGLQWTDMSGSVARSLPPARITDLFLEQPTGNLFAATYGRGLYSTPTSGLAPTVAVGSFSLDVTAPQGSTVTTGLPLTNLSTTATFAWHMTPFENWIILPESDGTLAANVSAQVPIRVSAAGLHAGTYIGHLQIVSGSYVQNVQIRLRVTASAAQITIVAGNGSRGAPGAGLPLQVRLTDASQRPLPGATVVFAVTSGGGSVSVRNSITNESGIATTMLTLPRTPGIVQVTATSGSLSATFTDTAVLGPVLLSDSVVDGVTFNPYTPFGPGGVLSISGQNLADANASALSSLPTMLLTTRVFINGPTGDVALPLFSVSPGQVRAYLPLETVPGVYSLRVETATIRSNEVQITVASFAPGIFTVRGTGTGRGIFLKPDGTMVSSANPADRGSTVSFYAAGLGAVTSQGRTVRNPRVFFDNYSADVISSGLASGLPGRYLVTVRLPAQLSPAANVSVSLTIGGFSSNRVTISVR